MSDLHSLCSQLDLDSDKLHTVKHNFNNLKQYAIFICHIVHKSTDAVNDFVAEISKLNISQYLDAIYSHYVVDENTLGFKKIIET